MVSKRHIQSSPSRQVQSKITSFNAWGQKRANHQMQMSPKKAGQSRNPFLALAKTEEDEDCNMESGNENATMEQVLSIMDSKTLNSPNSSGTEKIDNVTPWQGEDLPPPTRPWQRRTMYVNVIGPTHLFTRSNYRKHQCPNYATAVLVLCNR